MVDGIGLHLKAHPSKPAATLRLTGKIPFEADNGTSNRKARRHGVLPRNISKRRGKSPSLNATGCVPLGL